MEYTTFVRKPFTVEAVKITRENIEEIGGLIGTVLYKRGNGEPYIRVNLRIVPNVPQVYLGFYMTRMGDNIRCYSGKVFDQQFVQDSPEIQEWVRFLNGPEVEQTEESAEADVAEQLVEEESNVS